MPHLDEMLGVVTVAAAGLFAATTLSPLVTEALGGGAATCVDSPVAPAAVEPPVPASTASRSAALAAAVPAH